MKKKNIGAVFALYSTPDAIIGTEVDGKVNLINKDMILKADYVGIASGHKVDKPDVFELLSWNVRSCPFN